MWLFSFKWVSTVSLSRKMARDHERNFSFALGGYKKKPGRLAAKMGFWFRILFWFSTIVGTSLPRQFDPGHLRGKTPHQQQQHFYLKSATTIVVFLHDNTSQGAMN